MKKLLFILLVLLMGCEKEAVQVKKFDAGGLKAASNPMQLGEYDFIDGSVPSCVGIWYGYGDVSF
jgi:hypothetical protein